MDDGSASVFCFTPLRVPVWELAPVAACPPPHSPSSQSVCSAPASPPGTLSGLPAVRAGVRGVSARRLLESDARPGPRSRGPAESRVAAAGAASASRAATLGAERRLRGTAPRVPDAPGPTPPPGRRAASGRGAGAERRDYYPIFLGVEDQVFRPDKCHCSRCGQPFADFPAPKISESWRSRSGPIAESFAVAVMTTCGCGVSSGVVTAHHRLG